MTASSSEVTTCVSLSCPQHILDSILIQELKSEYEIVSIEKAKSAQQQVWILELSSSSSSSVAATVSNHTTSSLWKDCLKSGRNRLVIRQWKGGSQWWNLNRNQDSIFLARTEIFGYRCARQSLLARNTGLCEEQQQQDSTTTATTTTTTTTSWAGSVIIPRILHYFDPDISNSNDDNNLLAWAILEYVGKESIYFDNHFYDDSYLYGMVKTRYEFGFDEPHPRWGRVPLQDSLEYASLILEQVVIPLHKHSQSTTTSTLLEQPESNKRHVPKEVKTYENMVQVYQDAWQDMKKQQASHEKSMIGQEQPQHEDIILWTRMVEALDLLGTAVMTTLPSSIPTIPSLPFTLVHLDLQPQNLLFVRVNGKMRVSSVLDWEDAAMADPRFDLLLLGRKVCANREQAEELWKNYSESSSNDLGLLLPWLQLEAIHSITTLLLQSVDLLNGGRNPWESTQDLWGKLQREFERWRGLCQE